MGLGIFKLLEAVSERSCVPLVLPQRFLSPSRQGFKLIVVFLQVAAIEAQFTPGDELIEKCFRIGAHAPPSGAAAVRAQGDSLRRPSLALCNGRKNLVGGDVAKMQIGRQTARAVLAGLIAPLRIDIELVSDKTCQPRF